MRIATSSRSAVKSPSLKSLVRGAGRSAAPGLEALEPRMVLSGSPLPTLADLESPNDTVVRLETNYGDVDIELFNSAAPITVANFLNYVNSGRYGETFFHRSALNPNPFVLQGGGFSYTNAGGLSAVSTDAPIIREATGRSNLARTLAMARTSDINSATSQFFINYVDNTFLDPTSATTGYAVFGKVIQGWGVVQNIEALQSLDLTADPAFAGTNAGAFGEVPVRPTYNSNVGVRQADLVQLIGAEVIKPASVAGFFTQQVVYPEGFRSATSTETLDMFNPNSVGGAYQVIIRYETGQRDEVIASGNLAGHTKLEIALSDHAQSGLNLVRTGVPYSIEVQSAFPETLTPVEPIAASSYRVDFGGAAGESFFNTASTDSSLRQWDLPRIERNSGSREFIVYQNLAEVNARVTTVFHSSTGDHIYVQIIGPHRRGGIEVFSLGLPDGPISAHVTGSQDIVVAVSDWQLPPASQTTPTPAFGFLGVYGGGDTVGAYAGAEIRTGFTSVVSVFNPSGAAAAVTLTFWRSNGTTTTKNLSITAGGRSDLTLDPTDIGIPAGETFSITYSSDQPVAAQYTSYQTAAGSGTPSDGVSSTFTSGVSPQEYFADGRQDPTLGTGAQTETISLFNPFAAASNETYSYTVRYIFSDGTIIDGATGTLSPHGRVDVVSANIAAVRNKALLGTNFRNYSIEVIGSATNTNTNAVTQMAPVAVLTRWDNAAGRAVASEPMASGTQTALDDALFG